MIYKVRVILDAKDSVFRDIEIKDKQTLWNLHLGIKSAFSLQGDELSSFYFSDEEWIEGNAVPLEDMSDEGDGETMSDVYMKEAFPKKGAKMLFKYGLLDLWEFFCELQEISEEKPVVNYPITAFRFGNMPLKAPSKSGNGNGKITMPAVDDEFGEFSSDFKEDDFDDFNEEEEEEEGGYGEDFYDEEDLDKI